METVIRISQWQEARERGTEWLMDEEGGRRSPSHSPHGHKSRVYRRGPRLLALASTSSDVSTPLSLNGWDIQATTFPSP